MKRGLLLAMALLASTPALADVTMGAPMQAATALPAQLNDSERVAYRQTFQAIRSGDYAAAATALTGLPSGVLTPLARAELLLADKDLRDPTTVATLLTASPDLPEAPALAPYASSPVALPLQHALVRVAGPSKRGSSRPSRDCAVLAAQVQPLLKTNDAVGAEPIVEAAAAALTPEALTEWRERVAWTYFENGDDASAQRVATLAESGAGDWAVDAAWVNGLAAWHAQNYAGAADAFARVASNAGDSETRAAGLFWAARSERASGLAADADAHLQAAARLDATFYGMLAEAALGHAPSFGDLLPAGDTVALLQHPNLRAAAALVEIGETALADQLIRYQAVIGAPAEHPALIAFAARLGMPETQVWLAKNAPAGTRIALAARFPLPGWSPAQGWRVDPALVYAHALQESELRPDAVSKAGARGLMQLMPATAALIARHKGDAVRPLDDPAVSVEYGQSYLEELAAAGGTGGLLPKVIAAYNAGPNNVARWTSGQDDPLLFIESIPFAQTRAYVAIVLRNYWIYQREAGAATPSMTAMAEGKWPMFPGRAMQTASVAGATAGYAPD